MNQTEAMNEADLRCRALMNQPSNSASRLMDHISNFDAGPDVKVGVARVGETTFEIQTYVPIKTDAKYLLTMKASWEDRPITLVVDGCTLYNCATTNVRGELSLQSGVLEYLKKYGRIEADNTTLLLVEVRKLEPTPTYKTGYRVADGRVTNEIECPGIKRPHEN